MCVSSLFFEIIIMLMSKTRGLPPAEDRQARAHPVPSVTSSCDDTTWLENVPSGDVP